jgi:uncharacterized protein DUF4157
MSDRSSYGGDFSYYPHTREGADLDREQGGGWHGGGQVGKSPATAKLSRRQTIVFRVSDPETARALGESLRGGAGGRDGGYRDSNGVAVDADRAVERAGRGNGQPLPQAVRQQFETCLDVDLTGVRIHTGTDSGAAARAVGARAYTVGQDIHFGAGTYDPSSAGGLHLLAHEVAHTVQQAGATPHRQNKLEVSTPGDAAEVEADRAADAMVAGVPARVASAPAAIARVDALGTDDWNKQQDYSDADTKAPGADGWDPRFKGRKTDNIGQPDTYFRTHPNDPAYAKLAPASQQPNAGIKLPKITVTSGDIAAIYNGAKGKDGVDDAQMDLMIAAGNNHLAQMNAAFETMQIDTVQSQALFLAHQAGEAQGGNAMVEKGAKGRSYAPFQGRGPLQVTGGPAYIRTLTYLKARGDQLDAEIKTKTKTKTDLEGKANPSAEEKTQITELDAQIATATKQKAEIDECVKVCTADVRQAANPKFAYLFSAAYMHASRGVEKSGQVGATTVFDGVGPDESWESGGNNQVDLDNPGSDPTRPNMKSYTFEQYKALQQKHSKPTSDMDSAIRQGKIKQAVYASAYAVLNAKVKAAKAAAPQPQPPDDSGSAMPQMCGPGPMEL